jgi:hypothetical protein
MRSSFRHTRFPESLDIVLVHGAFVDGAPCEGVAFAPDRGESVATLGKDPNRWSAKPVYTVETEVGARLICPRSLKQSPILLISGATLTLVTVE